MITRMSQIEQAARVLGVSGIEDRLQENVKETIQVGFVIPIIVSFSMNVESVSGW